MQNKHNRPMNREIANALLRNNQFENRLKQQELTIERSQKVAADHVFEKQRQFFIEQYIKRDIPVTRLPGSMNHAHSEELLNGNDDRIGNGSHMGNCKRKVRRRRMSTESNKSIESVSSRRSSLPSYQSVEEERCSSPQPSHVTSRIRSMTIGPMSNEENSRSSNPICDFDYAVSALEKSRRRSQSLSDINHHDLSVRMFDLEEKNNNLLPPIYDGPLVNSRQNSPNPPRPSSQGQGQGQDEGQQSQKSTKQRQRKTSVVGQAPFETKVPTQNSHSHMMRSAHPDVKKSEDDKYLDEDEFEVYTPTENRKMMRRIWNSLPEHMMQQFCNKHEIITQAEIQKHRREKRLMNERHHNSKKVTNDPRWQNLELSLRKSSNPDRNETENNF